MNFFKVTFSDLKLPDILSLPTYEEEEERKAMVGAETPSSSRQMEEEEEEPSQEETREKEEYEEEVIWSGIGLGSFVKSFTQKSEEILQTYRRDLAEFGSGLKKETESIAGAVKEIPSSLEVGATVAQGSLETLGQAIEDIGSTVWKGTAEILSVVDSAVIDGREVSEAADSEIPMVNPAVVAKPYSRFEAQVLALQQDSRTYCEEPPEYTPSFSFSLDERKEQINGLLSENAFMQELFSRLVPDSVDEETFWRRYFFRMHKLELAEAARANLVKRAIDAEEEEDFSWESDEEIEAKRDENTDLASTPAESSTSSEFKPEIETKIKAEDKAGDKAEDKAEIKAEDKAEIKQESKLEIETDNKAENKAEVSAQSGNLNPPTHEDDDDLGWEVADGIDETPTNKSIKPLSSLDREDVRRKITVSAEDEELGWDLDDDEEEELKP